jgi:L-aminopeptidase/D-esterase-like protein
MAALSIASVPGVRVGHWTDLQAGTGCTVVLCETAGVVGVDVRGAAPATRETDLLRPGGLVGRAHAILLTGGSAFGLSAATGVMRFLEERGVGVRMRSGVVPIVSAAAIFDLGVGRADVRPDADAGYAACRVALEATSAEIAEGTVGAGTGATVAKSRGPDGALKGGIGTAARELPHGVMLGALVAVNAVGDIYDPSTARVVAGAPTPRQAGVGPSVGGPPGVGENTTIGVIATNARLDSAAINRLATLGHDGLALAIRPAHTLYDGDTLFAVSVPGADSVPGTVEADPMALGQAAAEVVAEAIVRGVRAATSLHGVPSVGW